MMSLNDFRHKYKFKIKATSNIKSYQVVSSLYLNDVKIYFRDGPFESDIGIVNLHQSKESHWVANINEIYFDSYDCIPHEKKLSKFVIKRNAHCLYSECQIQGLTSKRDSFCASYCLEMIYLTKVIGFDFKSAVLNLYYQMIQ